MQTATARGRTRDDQRARLHQIAEVDQASRRSTHPLPKQSAMTAVRDSYTVEQLQLWFRAADVDGDGVLTLAEFFRFCLLGQRSCVERVR